MSTTPHVPAGASSKPPEASARAQRFARVVVRPIERFLRIEAASGLILLIGAAVALIWANSAWSHSYHALWETPLRLQIGDWTLSASLHYVVNDILMAIFFFVVGLEIRREMNGGELSDLRRASLPVVAAIGGMLAPAAIYLMIAPGGDAQRGWGVPMATDIAFAVGVLALLGKRVPPALRVLLLALAIIDDIGAIIVIAVFYSSGIELAGFAIAGGGICAILMMQRLGIRNALAYVPAGVVVWAGVATAGVHPTIAGVIIGLITPARAWSASLGRTAAAQLDEIDTAAMTGTPRTTWSSRSSRSAAPTARRCRRSNASRRCSTRGSRTASCRCSRWPTPASISAASTSAPRRGSCSASRWAWCWASPSA